MAGFLTPRGKQLLLDTLAGAGDYLGLATGLPQGITPSLANIQEVTTPGYARKLITWNPATSSGDIYVDNTSDVQMGPVTEDMVSATYAFLTDVSTGNSLPAPVITTPLGAASSGGTFAAGTYYWRITALNSRGETITSNEVSQTLTANQQQALTWGAVSGATGYKVYRGTAAGAENILVTTLGAVTSYTDTGSAGTAATPPQVSTAAVGDLLYIWELAEPVRALANKPIYVPASGLIIE